MLYLTLYLFYVVSCALTAISKVLSLSHVLAISIRSYLVQRRKLSDPSEKLSDVQKTIVRLFQEKPATTTIWTETAFGEILIDFSLGVKLALQYRQDQRVVRGQIKWCVWNRFCDTKNLPERIRSITLSELNAV
jgi:hypothetical protein